MRSTAHAGVALNAKGSSTQVQGIQQLHLPYHLSDGFASFSGACDASYYPVIEQGFYRSDGCLKDLGIVTTWYGTENTVAESNRV